jgi:hypothetical protein
VHLLLSVKSGVWGILLYLQLYMEGCNIHVHPCSVCDKSKNGDIQGNSMYAAWNYLPDHMYNRGERFSYQLGLRERDVP